MPASVPPVPTEQMKPSTLPPVCSQISGPVEFVMRLGVVEVVPLIGEQHAVRLGLAQLVGEPFADMLVIVRIAVGQRRHFDQFGAAQPQHVLLFLALRLRNDDQGPVAARARHDRKADAGIAGGRFHHEAAGLEIAALLGFQDHPFAGAVLDRLAGIHELGLAENGAAGRFGGVLQLDQRRVADRFDDVVVDGHVWGNLPVCCKFRRDPKGAQKATSGQAFAVRRTTLTSRTSPAARRYFRTGNRPRNKRGNIPTAAGSDRRSRAASGSARPRGNYFARSPASWHNLARKRVRG